MLPGWPQATSCNQHRDGDDGAEQAQTILQEWKKARATKSNQLFLHQQWNMGRISMAVRVLDGHSTDTRWTLDGHYDGHYDGHW